MFKLDILEMNKDFTIVKTGEKIIYNTDNFECASDWVKEPLKGLKTFDAPQLTSATSIKNNGSGTLVSDSLGYMINNSNNVYKSSTGVALGSSTFAMAHGLSVHNKNFDRCVSLFTARKLINSTWINQKDEFLKPNENHQEYENFKNDSIVFSIFDTASNQSSLRQILYKGNYWDIKNQFFWISKNEMMELANEFNYGDLYNDARTDSDRYVYKLLFGEERIYDKLSSDAKLILNKATDIVRKSMVIREEFTNNENHLYSWDSGYAQLKPIWKECFPEDFKEFRDLFKKMEDRMRPLVYELGFLLK